MGAGRNRAERGTIAAGSLPAGQWFYMGVTVKDRRRTIVGVGQVVNFVPLSADFMPPFDKVTSVSVVPFTADGQIVAAILERGVDLPGGHVQEGERAFDEVARREAYEEAGITLRDVRVAQVIQSDYYGSAPDDLTYMVQATAFVDAFADFIPTDESSGRVMLSIDEFLRRYIAGDTEMMRRIVAAAHEVLFGAVPNY